jgi:hypothetical protein
MRTHTFARARAFGAAAAFIVIPPVAQASCGAASCNLLNDRFALGTWDHPGFSADFRLESITQDQLRQGTKKISPAELPEGEEAIERHTRNLNLVTTIDYAASREWSFALRIPVLHRDHAHDLLDEDTGEIGAHEQWRYTRVGDVQALMRWQAPSTNPDLSWALTAGLKLPTGTHTLANGQGVVAERSLQPGSGTTDLMLGGSARFVLTVADALNLQLGWSQALREADGYKPGHRLDLAAGWAHAMSPAWSVVLQANLTQRGRDSGPEAEPEVSGGTTLNLSPGISTAIGQHDLAYGFIQVPVYQKVNGIQLTPDGSLVLGWTHSF